MAVFLVNQCTFSKLPNVSNEPQPSPGTTVVGPNGTQSQPQQSVATATNNVVGVGLSSSNICGLKFDSLFELIHHIEDNHINDVEYQGVSGPFYNGHTQQHQHPLHHPHHQVSGMAQHPQQQHIQQQIYSDNQRMQNIINGHWLPTSCILRIFNSTHKPVKKEVAGGDNPIGSPATPLFQPHSQQPTPQPPHLQQPMTPQPHTPQQQLTPQPHHQPMTVDMVAPSPQMCTPNSMEASNSHHIILASPKIVGNMYHGSPAYHMPNATTHMTAVTLGAASPIVSQAMITDPQLVSVNNSIQSQTANHQQIQLQQTQQIPPTTTTQLQPQQTIQIQTQMHPHQHPQQLQPHTCTQTSQSQPMPTQLQSHIQLQPQMQPQAQIQGTMQAQMQPQLQHAMQQQMQHQEGLPVQVQLQTPVQLQSQLQSQQIQPTQIQTQILQQQQVLTQQIPTSQPQTTQQSQQQQQQSQPKAASTVKPHKCPDCGRSYKTLKNYTIHVTNQHQKEADVKSVASVESNNSTSKT